MQLRQYLEERNLPVAVFAARLKVNASSVYRYMSGRVPTTEILRRIQRATDDEVTPNDFFLSPANAGAACECGAPAVVFAPGEGEPSRAWCLVHWPCR